MSKTIMAINLGKTDEFILWTVEEFAELMDIQESTVRKMFAEGDLPAKKIARRWFVSNQALMDYFSSPFSSVEEKIK